MRLISGDKYIPGNRPWYTVPEGNDIIIRQREDNFEMARFNKKYKMVEIGESDYYEKIYIINQ